MVGWWIIYDPEYGQLEIINLYGHNMVGLESWIAHITGGNEI